MVVTIRFNPLKMLRALTGQPHWTEFDGPSTGTGVEYWYRSAAGTEAYICIDQDELVLSIDGDEIFGGSMDIIQDLYGE